MKKTAEETIIEKVGDFWWTCEDHKLDFLAAMEEYAFQSLPPVSEEEIKAILFINEWPYEDDCVSSNVQLSMSYGEATDNSIEIVEHWRKQYQIVLNVLSRLPQREVEQQEEKKEVEDRRLCMAPGSCINEDGECKDCRYFK